MLIFPCDYYDDDYSNISESNCRSALDNFPSIYSLRALMRVVIFYFFINFRLDLTVEQTDRLSFCSTSFTIGVGSF
jgi:hypothetical protein